MLLNSLKQRIIIIAEADEALSARIAEELQNRGFYNFKFAVNGHQIKNIIREYSKNPESINLVIADEELPQCHINDLYLSLCYIDSELFIPLIVLRGDLSTDYGEWELSNTCLVYNLNKTYNPVELQIACEFFILLKNEQYLRYKQQERLITELSERKVIDAKLKYLVAHDELTGLLNRSSLEQHIRLRLDRYSNRQPRRDSVLLFIDLDRFSLINELEGFEVGDRLLVEVIGVIRKTLNNTGLLVRIGSDEFCIYLENTTVFKAKIWAEKIRRHLDSFRFLIGTIAYSITVSIGLSSLKSARLILHPGELISRAHQACCMAKANGRNMVWEYNSEDVVIKERLRDVYWVPIIRDALLNKDFFLVFQPVVNLIDGDVSHYEVLIRLRGKQGIVIGPREFIPAAERMGLIHSIDLWVVENAIDYLAALPPELSHISLAINLSSAAFQDEALLPMIKQKFELTWVSAPRITFEITETAAVENFEQTRFMINQIRALGCHFALDDFGAGFCSFNYLKKFPVDYVKIDAQFIQNLVNDETDRLLVHSMHQIAKKLGKKTIAEFVECLETVRILREIGINYGQGYIFGAPKEHFLEKSVFQINELLQNSEATVNLN
ncbi:MAG: EAL domain-containing protein [Methylobacter sp.]|nr:EAL domain-containing protein [Methylobacter sp.]